MSRFLVQHEESNELIYDALHIIEFNYIMAIITHLKENYWNNNIDLKEELIYNEGLPSSIINYELDFLSLFKWLYDNSNSGVLDIILTKVLVDEQKTQKEYKRFVHATLGLMKDEVNLITDVEADVSLYKIERMKIILQQLFNSMNRCVNKHDKIRLIIST